MSAEAVPFRHDETGTDEEHWLACPEWEGLPGLDVPAHDALVVVAAHPDDETLGAGGLLRLAAAAGLPVTVVLLSNGEASHPDSPTWTPEALAAQREAETRAAVGMLAARARLVVCGLPDGRLGEHVDTIVAAVVDAIGATGSRTLVVAPWRGDGHPGHEAAGRAASIAARRTDARAVEYPVWLWHWGTRASVPWREAMVLPLDAVTHRSKSQALALHRTQMAPLSDEPGDEQLLSPEFVGHFLRRHETFLAEPAEPDVALDELHRSDADPWRTDTDWYEQRKRATTLAALPRRRFVRALEVGCSAGALAADLATRCDAVLAVDSSAAAVEHARARLHHLDHVEVRRADAVDDHPEGPFDLVVVSEVGYFLSPERLRELRRRVEEGLTDDGVVLLCHWRHEVVGWPLDGPSVHDLWRAATGLDVLVEHVEPDFLLTVLGPRSTHPTGAAHGTHDPEGGRS
ncbi:bifunctional PIG-L family deacetylase/class I SAM-dependent methyltransferase [Intrasporangium flavum]|uniref:bifunctional PIG-L family deacetylase/class I SAM-dependent methyltransferase n=1 Tax=Intrasporangium flavum TaxID=1428657 RepID=UPI0009FA2772|nr:bifunctional PIG-L family deacetylase/class I SAM-dependent methyltransferase [Intrasporangium flavum]